MSYIIFVLFILLISSTDNTVQPETTQPNDTSAPETTTVETTVVETTVSVDPTYGTGTEAIATFNNILTGTIRFLQENNGVKVHVSLAYTDSSTDATEPHKFHIHESPVTGGDCNSAGGHWDPTGADVDGYTCDSNTPALCYSGDLSGKHGTISIPVSNYEFMDDTINLGGFYARGIVVHAVDGSRMDCASVILDTSSLTVLDPGTSGWEGAEAGGFGTFAMNCLFITSLGCACFAIYAVARHEKTTNIDNYTPKQPPVRKFSGFPKIPQQKAKQDWESIDIRPPPVQSSNKRQAQTSSEQFNFEDVENRKRDASLQSVSLA